MTNGTSQGLMVVVSLVIFGIFVLMAYFLFGDKLENGLATIVGDGLNQVVPSEQEQEDENVVETEDGYIIAKIRDGNGSDITDVWVKALIESDNTLTIESSNNVGKDFVGSVDGTSKNIKGGSLTIPSSLKGKQVVSIKDFTFYSSTYEGDFNAQSVSDIGDGAFYRSTFKGTFNAPNVTKLGNQAFIKSKFTGTFNSPNVTWIGYNAFWESKFTGDFNAPYLTYIGDTAFRESTFKGTFNAQSITSIGNYAFEVSEFTGTFNTPNLTYIGWYTFNKAKFTRVTANNLKELGVNSIRMYNNNYYTIKK